MTGTDSPFQPRPDGANKDFDDRQRLLAELVRSRRGQVN
jgi:hypothetical protein